MIFSTDFIFYLRYKIVEPTQNRATVTNKLNKEKTMKKYLFAIGFIATMSLCSAQTIETQKIDLSQVNYETLANNNWTDHVRAFRCLFAVTHINHFVEFGMGVGTKYFLDHCDHVTSVEISIPSRSSRIDPWYEIC